MKPSSLSHVPAEIWQHLQVGNGNWRTPVLATARAAGGADARTVVLREVDTETRRVVFFTDRRSAKVEQLDADAQACLVVYDDERRLQARLYGPAERIAETGRLDTYWQSLGNQQQRLYAVDVIADSLGSDDEKGRENFAAFEITIGKFHCLWIGESMNEAAEFHWRDGQWQARIVRA